MKNKKIAATVAALMAQVIFGFSFMFSKIAMNTASPMTVIADRYIVAFVGLSFVVLFTKTKIKFNKNIWKLVLMSLFQPVLYFVFESYGISMTTSSFSSVMISLIPVISMISGIFLLKEIPTPAQYIFTAMSVLGVVIMTFIGKSEGTVTFAGVILLFLAVLSSVSYNVSSRMISKEFDAVERTYAMTVIGLIVFVSIALVENRHNPANIILPFANPMYTASILYLGCISSVVAFILLNYANTHLPVSKTTVFSNLTTVVSVFAGAVFLDEKLSVYSIVATCMIVAGVWGVQTQNVKSVK